MALAPKRVFFAYPSAPAPTRTTIASAAKLIARTAGVRVSTWEDTSTVGQFIVSAILEAIDASDVIVCEVSELNQNVMFELGYAIGRERPIWLLRDESIVGCRESWRELNTLATVTYCNYVNADGVAAVFQLQKPHERGAPLVRAHPRANPPPHASLLILLSPYQTDGQLHVVRRVERETTKGLRIVRIDPAEFASMPLAWYMQRIRDADAIIAHYTADNRIGARVHNARWALVCGIAHAMGKPVLMLSETSYAAPLDYKDMLVTYQAPPQAVSRVGEWLRTALLPAYERLNEVKRREASTGAVPALERLDLGDPVAENEEETLGSYFVRTGTFSEITSGKTVLIAGRKGSGKTAAFLRAAAEFRGRGHHLVCTIQPQGFDFEGLIHVVKRFESGGSGAYVVESLWKYLITTEIALAIHQDLSAREIATLSHDVELPMLTFLGRYSATIEPDFSVRLETALRAVGSSGAAASVEDGRRRISEALHAGPILELNERIRPILRTFHRVVVLIDNLDKGWERTADTERLARILTGLLSASRHLTESLSKGGIGRLGGGPHVAVIPFIRSDILERLSPAVRERDKLPVVRLQWDDAHLLRRIVEQRGVESLRIASPEEFWSTVFATRLVDESVPEMVLRCVIPRPRDILVFCKCAVLVARDRGHGLIEEEDLQEARLQYSNFAIDALRVESAASEYSVDELFVQMLGMSRIVDENEIVAAVARGGLLEPRARDVLRQLVEMSFVGYEIEVGRFEFVADRSGAERVRAVAYNRAGAAGRPVRMSVHAAYCPYLDLRD